jgi:OOP family OmpA-OmpF porin
MTSIIDWPRYSRWTWIVAVLLFLLLLVLWLSANGPGGAAACCGGSESAATSPPVVAHAPAPAQITPAPAPAAAAPKVVGELKFIVDGGKLVLEGFVPDQATKDRLLQAAIASYGDGNVVDNLLIDATHSASQCADKAAALFAALKNGPAIGVDCTADGVILTGTVASESDKAARDQWARDFFGVDAHIVNQLRVVAPPAPVAKAEDVRCGSDKIAAAVTFATGSATIDAAGRRLLDAIAACLKDGQYEIAGYTDNVGSVETNMPLSKARAEAVRVHLIGKGVSSERLTTVGHGADNPIADNATEEGRAKNRRIEFTKK